MTLSANLRLALSLALLAAATFAVYAPSLPAPYMWDDISLIAQNPTLDDAANIPRYFTEDLGVFNRDPRRMGFYRPLQALSFHLEVMLFGRRAPLQRAINVLWHVLAAIALFLFARSLVDSRWAYLAGLLFALHPLCSEQVCLIANRGGLLTGALLLWTLVLLARAVPAEGAIKKRWLVAAMIAYLAALLAKPEALTLAAPAAAWLWLARPQRRRDARTWLATVALPGAMAALFAVWHWVILGISHAHKAANVEGGAVVRLLAGPRLTLEALRLSLMPVGLRAIRSLDYHAWSSVSVVVVSIVVWLMIFFVAWRVRRKAPAVTFAAVFFAAAMAPSAGVVPLVRPIAEHYYYLPAAAASLALAAAGAQFNHRLARVLVAVVVIAFALLTAQRAWTWRSEESLWTDNLAQEPNDAQVINNLGTIYAEAGQRRRAFDLFTRAVAANPGNLKARLNRAHLAVSLGQWADALDDLRVLLANEPCQTKTLVQLGRLTVLHPTPDSAALAAQLRSGHPCAAAIDVGAGLAWDEQGRTLEARRAFQRFLQAAPDHSLAAAVRARLEHGSGLDEKDEKR